MVKVCGFFPFNVRTRLKPDDGFYTMFAPKSMRWNEDTAAWRNHDRHLVIARRRDRTLGFCQTDYGLWFCAWCTDRLKSDAVSAFAARAWSVACLSVGIMSVASGAPGHG